MIEAAGAGTEGPPPPLAVRPLAGSPTAKTGADTDHAAGAPNNIASVAANPNGVVVTNVQPDTPFDRIGLQSGDVVMSINGAPLHGQTDVAQWLYPILRGQRAQAHVLRGGHTLALTLAFALPDARGAEALVVAPAQAAVPR